MPSYPEDWSETMRNAIVDWVKVELARGTRAKVVDVVVLTAVNGATYTYSVRTPGPLVDPGQIMPVQPAAVTTAVSAVAAPGDTVQIIRDKLLAQHLALAIFDPTSGPALVTAIALGTDAIQITEITPANGEIGVSEIDPNLDVLTEYVHRDDKRQVFGQPMWSDQDAPRATKPYVLIQVIGNPQSLAPSEDIKTDAGVDRMDLSVQQPAEVMINLQVIGDRDHKKVAERLRLSSQQAFVRERLLAAGLIPTENPVVRDVSALFSGLHERRYLIEVPMQVLLKSDYENVDFVSTSDPVVMTVVE